MQFLKTLFWVVVAVVVAVFAMRNWTIVSLNLWGGLVMDAKLPVLLGIAFLAGLVPAWIALSARLWRVKRRLEAAERAVADTRTVDLSGEPVPAPVVPPVAPGPIA